MKVIIRTIKGTKGEDIGSVLTADVGRITDVWEKKNIENSLINYAFGEVYPSTSLHLYSNVHADTPSITVLKDINSLDQRSENI